MENNFFPVRNDEMMRRAIARARQLRPVVRCVDAVRRLFSVESRRNRKRYLVEFRVTETGVRLASCRDQNGLPCPGMTPRARCYHVAAAAAANIYVQTVRRQIAEADA